MPRTALIAAIAVVIIVAAVIVATRSLPQYGGAPEETPAAQTTPATTPAGQEATPAQQEAQKTRELTIDATEYEFTPGTIEVSPGERLIITVKNTGRIFHTFTIDELNIDVALNPGDEKTVEVVIPSGVDKITFYCRPHVGLGMVGEFVVGG
ncbi:MAG: cupredoxin domain-containing protein, partial [Desulfurococcales archaeon]|nr:cupredoxin domain-containing protein [Desulfurococcales archaeon]